MRKTLIVLFVGIVVIAAMNRWIRADVVADTIKRAGRYITKVDYDSGGNPVYIGFAPSGAQDTDEEWTILKSSFNASNNFIAQQSCPDHQQWSARASLTCN